jgi:hypothetical protein
MLLTLVLAGWFLLVRGGAGTREFVRATERFVAAGHTAEEAIQDITRFAELDQFDVTVRAEIDRMGRQAAVFRRLATDGDGEEARLAERAVTEADRVIAATGAYHDALVQTNKPLSQAAAAIVEMQAGMVELDRIADEWERRS